VYVTTRVGKGIDVLGNITGTAGHTFGEGQVIGREFQLEDGALAWRRSSSLILTIIVEQLVFRIGFLVVRATALGGSSTRRSSNVAFNFLLRFFFHLVEVEILGQVFLVRGDGIVRAAPSLLWGRPRLFLGAGLRLPAGGTRIVSVVAIVLVVGVGLVGDLI
jgi:hypothetical protein